MQRPDTIAASAGAAAGCELGTAPSAARRTMRTETRSENGKTAASAVTADAVRARTVTASTVTADAVTARTMTASTVTADAVTARTMTASTVTADAVTASTVTASTVTASTFGGLDLPCRNEPDLFFAESPQDVESAKALCRGCPARLACLAGAIERREPWGVWGGELFLRGEIVPRKRPRGRPRKSEVAA